MKCLSLVEIKYEPDLLCIHSSAGPAYRAWLDAAPVSQRFPAERLLSTESRTDALRHSPVPAIKRANLGRRNTYEVIGRFNIYYQIQVLKPEKVTLAVLNASNRRVWPNQRIEELSQALQVLDIGGRCAPLRELSAVFKGHGVAGGVAGTERP